jgi:carbon storage regulator
MLVLSRKQGESIVIGQGVCVTVDRVDRHRVRLAIDAPDEVAVDRREVWLRKQDDDGPATSSAPGGPPLPVPPSTR